MAEDVITKKEKILSKFLDLRKEIGNAFTGQNQRSARFIAKHVISRIEDAEGNGDEIFNQTGIRKDTTRTADGHNPDNLPGEDEYVYESRDPYAQHVNLLGNKGWEREDAGRYVHEKHPNHVINLHRDTPGGLAWSHSDDEKDMEYHRDVGFKSFKDYMKKNFYGKSGLEFEESFNQLASGTFHPDSVNDRHSLSQALHAHLVHDEDDDTHKGYAHASDPGMQDVLKAHGWEHEESRSNAGRLERQYTKRHPLGHARLTYTMHGPNRPHIELDQTFRKPYAEGLEEAHIRPGSVALLPTGSRLNTKKPEQNWLHKDWHSSSGSHPTYVHLKDHGSGKEIVAATFGDGPEVGSHFDVHHDQTFRHQGHFHVVGKGTVNDIKPGSYPLHVYK